MCSHSQTYGEQQSSSSYNSNCFLKVQKHYSLLCVYHLYSSAPDQRLCLYVHRAIFAYDGVTNKLKLADSGGKVGVHVCQKQ